jgi:hypothetical protein
MARRPDKRLSGNEGELSWEITDILEIYIISEREAFYAFENLFNAGYRLGPDYCPGSYHSHGG